MNLHVLQLGPVPPPEGGIVRNIAAIRRLLSKNGSRSTVIATSRSEHIRPEPDVFHPRTPAEFLSTVRSIDCDILHLHIGGDVTPRVLAMAFACTLFGKGKKILTVHSGGFALDQARSANRGSFAGLVFRRFSKVIAVNDDLAAVFRGLGVVDANIETILPFALEAPPENVEIPAHVLNFCTAHSPLLISVGGMEKDYEPKLQIDAFEQVRMGHPSAGLIFLGGGSLTDEVSEYLRNRGLSDSVLLAGSLDHEVALQLIKDADLMLRVTLFDGDAISVREALFLGTPVVATDNRMRPAGARLVPIGDADSLVAEINAVLANPLQKAAYFPPSDYSHIQKVIDLYERLAGNGV